MFFSFLIFCNQDFSGNPSKNQTEIGEIKIGSESFPVALGVRLEDQSQPKVFVQTPQPQSFIAPGKIRDPRNKRVLASIESYFGNCLGDGPVYISYIQEQVDRKGLRTSAFIGKWEENRFDETLVTHPKKFPRRETVQKNVKLGQCKAIPPVNRPFAINAVPKLPFTPKKG